jgi:hypothetical protein
MPERTPVTFTLEELWLLQSKVRHEMSGQDQWKIPPTSQELNDQIATGILFCEENGQPEACLSLSLDDCFAIDYAVPQEAKSSGGSPLGKPVLRKAFAARVALRVGWQAISEEPVDSQVDVSIMMPLFESEYRKGKKAD